MTACYNAQGERMTQAAFYSLKAAMMISQIGRYAALLHCLKNGGSLRLFTLARQLLAVQKFDRQAGF